MSFKKHWEKVCISLIGVLAVAFASAFWDTKTLKVEVVNLKERQDKTEKQIDGMYWYLIEKNNIIIPERKR